MQRRRVGRVAPLVQKSVFGDSGSGSESEGAQEAKDVTTKEATHTPPPPTPPPPRQQPPSEDASSTNLVVHNLSPHTTERHLTRAFSRFGAITSVKIMWPRGNGSIGGSMVSSEASTGHTAFVSFNERAHAEQALRAMDGGRVDGRGVQVAWARTQPRHQTITAPEDPRLLRLVHWTVDHVLAHGAGFEHALIHRNQPTDGRFRFLTEWHTPAHLYYRWRLYSRANGDAGGGGRWRTRAFRMYDDREAPLVRPPVAPESRMRLRFARRVDRAVGRGGNWAVARAMAFAVEHAADADTLVDEVCRALARCRLPGSRPLAALHVVSDVLHNSAVARVPGVWRLRAAAERRLDDLFGALQRVVGRDEYPGVLAVLAVWQAWMVFPEQRLVELAQKFM
ncbi:hypothetical protein LPJ53_002917 [Coemansia erecta]|uniref:RRM domain-containing protein n=1 Tax=Coemansia erecta TaxID=147472 RepID=A0A9W7Y2B5_9FUNG|nr:hypothetical protein LPJ53_002917 [Coemansia erecta]